jgi:hypothetical protein
MMLLTKKGDYDTMKPWNESEHPRDPNGKFTDKGGDGGYRERVNAQIKWAAENGVVKGTTATTFAPNETCTRGQIVTFLFRAFA